MSLVQGFGREFIQSTGRQRNPVVALPGYETVEGVCIHFGMMPWTYDVAVLQTTKYLKKVRLIEATDWWGYGAGWWSETTEYNAIDGNLVAGSPSTAGDATYSGGFGVVPVVSTSTTPTEIITTFDDGGPHPGGGAGTVTETLSVPFTVADATALAESACYWITGAGPYHAYYWLDGTDIGVFKYGMDAPYHSMWHVNHATCRWSTLCPDNKAMDENGYGIDPMCQRLSFNGSAGPDVPGEVNQAITVHIKRGRVRSHTGISEVIQTYDISGSVFDSPTSYGRVTGTAGDYYFPIPSSQERRALYGWLPNPP